jgi:hypothetical protein
MNGTGFSTKQRTGLVDLYKLADKIREYKPGLVHYTKFRYEELVYRMKDRIVSIISDNTTDEDDVDFNTLTWVCMVLEIYDDIIKNSPLPITVIGNDREVQEISTAYAIIVGHKVETILNPDFVKVLYPGIE